MLQSHLADLQIIADQRENEVEEAMDEQAEHKFMKMQDIKRKFTLKIKFAQKQGDDTKELEAGMKVELKRAEATWQQESKGVKLQIKQQYNNKALQLNEQIEVGTFVKLCIKS